MPARIGDKPLDGVLSVRLRAEDIAWIETQAVEHKISTASVLRGYVRDKRQAEDSLQPNVCQLSRPRKARPACNKIHCQSRNPD